MLSSLAVTNFRNYAQQEFRFDHPITLVVGPNASGKTNLLESLYVLASTRSFRAKDGELIRHGEQFFRIEARLDELGLALGYEERPEGHRKQAAHDGVKKSLTQHIGALQAVLFEPNDLLLIYGPPERRRRYLNFILSQTDPVYLKALHNYRRVLQQRNRLLADWRGDEAQLFAWNLKLTEYASEIINKRQDLLTYINERISDLYAGVAGQAEALALNYQSTTQDPIQFMEALELSLARDIGAGFTTIGPHRDDFDISFKGGAINTLASRGEIRTAVLSLKLAELEYIDERSGQSSILLLDDVFSELDGSRRRALLGNLGGHQVIITTTNADSVTGDLEGSYGMIKTAELASA